MEDATKDLKIEALRERIAVLARTYEDNIADLRVRLTILDQENKSLTEVQETQSKEIERLEGEVARLNALVAETKEEDAPKKKAKKSSD